MKRFACLAVIFPLLSVSVFGQIVFHDDFQSTELNRFLVGDLNGEWTLYNDDNAPSTSPDLTYFDKAWKTMRAENGDMFAASISYFRGNGGTADRWMVSPAIDLSDTENPVLVFRSKVLDVNNRDGFEVKISTQGIEKENFTKTLTSVAHGRSLWTYYTFDLSEYKEQSIHVAFIQNSKNQYILGIDDILVHQTAETCALVNAFSTPYAHIANGNVFSITASAEIFNAGSAAITSYTLCKQVDGGQISRETISGTDIASGSALGVSTSFSLASAGEHTLSLWIENINGTETSSPQTSVKVLTVNSLNLPKKNMLLEIFSSGMCTACAPWNAVLHPFFISDRANTPDNRGNFCVVKYQVDIPSVGDPCVTEQTLSRAGFYGVNSAPSFYMNGKSMPLAANEEIMFRSLRDSIARYGQTSVPTGLTARLERDGNTFRVHADITNYLPDINNYALVVCLMEDSIEHNRTMHNGEKIFYNVVRQMLPNTVGSEIIPETVGKTTSRDFEFTFDLQNPQIFSSVENMSAVVFLQNTNTREVIQARYLADGVNDTSIIVENRPVERMQKQLSVYPNPVTERCLVSFVSAIRTQAEWQILDMQGKTVFSRRILLKEGENRFETETGNLPAGLYFIRIQNEQGVFVHKMVKR